MYSCVSPIQTLSGAEKLQQQRLAETRPGVLLWDGPFLVALAVWVCPGSAADERSADQLCRERSHRTPGVLSPLWKKLVCLSRRLICYNVGTISETLHATVTPCGYSVDHIMQSCVLRHNTEMITPTHNLTIDHISRPLDSLVPSLISASTADCIYLNSFFIRLYLIILMVLHPKPAATSSTSAQKWNHKTKVMLKAD